MDNLYREMRFVWWIHTVSMLDVHVLNYIKWLHKQKSFDPSRFEIKV